MILRPDSYSLQSTHHILISFLTGTMAWLALTSAVFAQQASDLDWITWDLLTPQQRLLVPDACCGLYVEPQLPPATGVPDNILLNADSLNADYETGIIDLDGSVFMRQDNTRLQGDSGRYDNRTETMTLQGNVRLRQPGLLIAGSDAVVDRNAARSEINQASYVLHDQAIRGTAEIIVYTDTDGIVTIDNGLFSRCEPGDNSWMISGREISLDREAGRGIARDVTLKVNDFPVFYLPLVSFPINDERASGFLAPIIGSTRDGGFDFAAPYYFNLAPNYDATLTPRILTDRGLMLGLETRYLNRFSTNTLNLAWMPEDDLYNPMLAAIPTSNSPPQKERWFLGLDHGGRLGARWTSYIDYSAVSDEDYFQDLGNTGLDVTTQSFLYRTALLRYSGRNWRFTTSTLGYQVIDPAVSAISKPYDRLPRLNLEGTFFTDSGVEYGLESEYVYFDRDMDSAAISQAQIDDGVLVTGGRLTVEPTISYPWTTPGTFIIPSARYRYATYQLENQALNAPDKPGRGVFTGSLDSGLIFERELQLADTGFNQTLEPRLFYLYSEYEDQSDIPVFDSAAMTFSFNQLFRTDRFSGQDRVGDTNQLTAALTTRLLDDRGREKAAASIGRIRYFEDRLVTLNNLPGEAERRSNSSLAGEISWQFNDNWRAYSYLEWNNSDNTVDAGNFQFRYQSDINHILNFGYRYRDVPNPVIVSGIDRRIKQTDISAVWPVSDNWGLIGRWNYDHANDRTLETIVGLEYSNCCWNMRVIAREWIDNDALFFGNVDNNTGVFLQFELKGLGSVLGGNVSGILNNGISGYREREYEQ